MPGADRIEWTKRLNKPDFVLFFGVTGQEERDKEVQGHVHGAEHRSGKSGARGRRAERKPEAGSSGAGTDVAVTTCQFYFLIICHLAPQFTSDLYRDKDVFTALTFLTLNL